MIPRVQIDRWWRVRAVMEVSLPCDAGRVWSVMRDPRRFACVDPFHRRIRRLRRGDSRPDLLRAGERIAIEHTWWATLGLVRFERIGRLLTYRDPPIGGGGGYAFSDLSRRDPRRGFPHVYRYTLVSRSEGSRGCVVRIEVMGRWTATHLSRPVARGWLFMVMLAIAASGRLHVMRAVLRNTSLRPCSETRGGAPC